MGSLDGPEVPTLLELPLLESSDSEDDPDCESGSQVSEHSHQSMNFFEKLVNMKSTIVDEKERTKSQLKLTETFKDGKKIFRAVVVDITFDSSRSYEVIENSDEMMGPNDDESSEPHEFRVIVDHLNEASLGRESSDGSESFRQMAAPLMTHEEAFQLSQMNIPIRRILTTDKTRTDSLNQG